MSAPIHTVVRIQELRTDLAQHLAQAAEWEEAIDAARLAREAARAVGDVEARWAAIQDIGKYTMEITHLWRKMAALKAELNTLEANTTNGGDA